MNLELTSSSVSDSELPCLYSNNCTEITGEIAENPFPELAFSDISEIKKMSTQHKKTASNLTFAVQELARKHSIEKIGFLTLTFAEFITDPKESQKRLNSLSTHVLKQRYKAYIRVFERCKSGRIHYHLLVVLKDDIRTGFDFEEIKKHNYKSANKALRSEWSFWRKTAKKYGFGRTELLPVKSTADGVAKYVGKYISKNVEQRLDEDKGVRLVSYSKDAKIGSTRFTFVSDGSAIWRRKMAIFAHLVAYNFNKKSIVYEDLQVLLGKRWSYHYTNFIISLPDFSDISLALEFVQDDAFENYKNEFVPDNLMGADEKKNIELLINSLPDKHRNYLHDLDPF